MGYRDNDQSREGRGRAWRRKNLMAKELNKKQYQGRSEKPKTEYHREKVTRTNLEDYTEASEDAEKE